MNKILNISNSLSFIRLLLAIPLFLAFYADSSITVLIICIIAYLTDIGDGYFARKLNQITEFGKMLDPLADKIFVGLFVVIMLLHSKIPIWFGTIIILRDILILIGGLYITSKLKYVIPSNYLGKFTVIFIAASLLLSLFTNGEYLLWVYLFVAFFVLLSFMVYLIGMIKKLQNL
jgi:CDP-diacylglycerol--glycerol-3-phosphate 3-phosphatidyltransferase